MSFGNLTESGVLSWIFRANDPFDNSKYDTLYIGLASGSIDDEGGNLLDVELTGTNYSRVSVVNNSSNWVVATGLQPTVKYNKVNISFLNPSNDWGTVTNFFISTSGSGSGNLVAHGSIFPSKPIYADDPVEFDISGIRLSVN